MENNNINYKFNMNEFVKVKLTVKGLEYYKNHFKLNCRLDDDEINKMYQENIDEYNYLSLQLWEFMNIFGCLDIDIDKYLEMNIILNSKDLKNIPHKNIAVICDTINEFNNWKEKTFIITYNDKKNSFFSNNCKYYCINNYNYLRGMVVDDFINISKHDLSFKFGDMKELEVHLKSKCSSYL